MRHIWKIWEGGERGGGLHGGKRKTMLGSLGTQTNGALIERERRARLAWEMGEAGDADTKAIDRESSA